jgi:hypothetical protein
MRFGVRRDEGMLKNERLESSRHRCDKNAQQITHAVAIVDGIPSEPSLASPSFSPP